MGLVIEELPIDRIRIEALPTDEEVLRGMGDWVQSDLLLEGELEQWFHPPTDVELTILALKPRSWFGEVIYYLRIRYLTKRGRMAVEVESGDKSFVASRLRYYRLKVCEDLLQGWDAPFQYGRRKKKG